MESTDHTEARRVDFSFFTSVEGSPRCSLSAEQLRQAFDSFIIALSQTREWTLGPPVPVDDTESMMGTDGHFTVFGVSMKVYTQYPDDPPLTASISRQHLQEVILMVDGVRNLSVDIGVDFEV